MVEPNTHEGGCHCGRVRYRIAATLAQVVDCNCSICLKRGALWAFVKPSQFTLLAGKDALTDYQFAKKHIHHLFCTSCGIASFARGSSPNGEEMYAVNTRCLDGIDVGSLKIVPFDGKSL
jgi:hypothetical protein